ncbi:MAG: hypothetical protein SFV15_24070 [Polyangiaceae bacterium]|nr:hypothetical protein [Polyangiaceae bacterium]
MTALRQPKLRARRVLVWILPAPLLLIGIVAVIATVSQSSEGNERRIDSFLKIADPLQRWQNLDEVAQACFEEERPCAERYGREAMESTRRSVEAGLANAWELEASHDGHVVLGELALAKGDVTQAKEHLRLASSFRTDALGNSKMPSMFILNMSLASALIRKGELDTVMRYLERLDQRWDRPEIKDWKGYVPHGAVPPFGKYTE